MPRYRCGNWRVSHVTWVRAARQALGVAEQRLAAGDALVLFGEGTRSRSSPERLRTGATYTVVP